MTTPQGFTVAVPTPKLRTLLAQRIARLEVLQLEAVAREEELAKVGGAVHAPGCNHGGKGSEQYQTLGKSLTLVLELINRASTSALRASGDEYELSHRDLVTLDLAVGELSDVISGHVGAGVFTVTVTRVHLVTLLQQRVGRLEELRVEEMKREEKLTQAHGRPPLGIQLMSAVLEGQAKSLAILADLVAGDPRGAQNLTLDDLIALTLIAPSIGILASGHYA